jgi:cell division protein FtsL
MNFHVSSIKRNRTGRRKRNTRNGYGSFFWHNIFVLIIIVAGIFLVVNLRISYSQKTEKLNREAAKLKYRIHKTEREIEHLRIERERLSGWKHIKRRVKAFRLALRAPEPNQVQPLAITGEKTAGRLKQPGQRQYMLTKR